MAFQFRSNEDNKQGDRSRIRDYRQIVTLKCPLRSGDTDPNFICPDTSIWTDGRLVLFQPWYPPN